MEQGVCEMANKTIRFPNGVDRAIDITTNLLKLVRRQHGNDRQAISEIAGSARVSPAAVRNFIHPSRRPKKVDVDVLDGLRGAYLRFLRQQLAALNNEILRIETMGIADGTLPHLLDEAQALVARIEALL